MKKLSYLFIAIAILLSNIMCSVVAFNYRDMLCGIEHLGYCEGTRNIEVGTRNIKLTTLDKGRQRLILARRKRDK